MKLTVTLNTKDSEYADIEVEVDGFAHLSEIIVEAVKQTDVDAKDVTSFVVVGVSGH
jgi:hypothetical protein